MYVFCHASFLPAFPCLSRIDLGVPPQPGRGWRWPLRGLAQRSTDHESIGGVEPINRGGLAPLLLTRPPRPSSAGGAESLDVARLGTERSCCPSAPQSPVMSKDRAPQRGDGHAWRAGAGGGQGVGRVQAAALPPGIDLLCVTGQNPDEFVTLSRCSWPLYV